MDQDEKKVQEITVRVFLWISSIHILSALGLVAYATWIGGMYAFQAWFLILMPLTYAVYKEVDKSAKTKEA